MAGEGNPFFVAPPNVLQALLMGQQGFNTAQKAGQDAAIRQGRIDAVQAMQQGGDLRTPLMTLLGVGDVHGAGMIANYAQQQATQQHQAAQLAESSRHNRAAEGLQSRQIGVTENAPVIVPFGSGVMNKKGEMLKEPSGEASIDEKTLGFMADQYMAGDTSVLTNLGRGAQGAQNVVALRKEIARRNQALEQNGADQANRNFEAFGVKAGQRTLGTRSANIELAATEFQQVLPVVVKASEAVSRTNYPDLNKVIQAYNEKTGDPNIVAFGGGVNTLVNLYARAISPTGQPTVSDKDHAREILNKAWSSGQFNAAVGMMKQEIDAALNSPGKVREDMRKRFLEGQPGAKPAALPSGNQPATGAPSVDDLLKKYGQ